MPETQRQATLQAGARRIPALLCDESAEGAAAGVDCDPGLRSGDVVQLFTSFGRFEARVVHVTKADPARTAEKKAGPQYRVGFEWIRELAMSRHD